MGLFDFFKGFSGNTKVAAKSTLSIFNEGFHYFGDYDKAFKYTFIFRYNTTAKYLSSLNNPDVINNYLNSDINNLTDITVANLNADAAPPGTLYEQTKKDFYNDIARYLIQKNIPYQYACGNNAELVVDIINYARFNKIVSPSMYDVLINLPPK